MDSVQYSRAEFTIPTDSHYNSKTERALYSEVILSLSWRKASCGVSIDKSRARLTSNC